MRHEWADGDVLMNAKELLESASGFLGIESIEERSCAFVTHRGSRYVDPEPDEFCERDALLDSDYCALHDGMGDDE